VFTVTVALRAVEWSDRVSVSGTARPEKPNRGHATWLWVNISFMLLGKKLAGR